MFTNKKKCPPCTLGGVAVGMLIAAGIGGVLFLMRRRLPMISRTVGKAMEECAEGMADVCRREADC